jgi:hypothetical protein
MPEPRTERVHEQQLPGLEEPGDEPIDGGDRIAPEDDDAAPAVITDADAARRLQTG